VAPPEPRVGRKEFFAVSTCRYRVSIGATLLLILSAAVARADGLLYQLPKDGAWASYDFNCTAKAGDHEKTVTGMLRMASVGQVTEQEQPCRWIEVQLNVEAVVEGKKARNERTCKLLIPEKWLAKGQSPLDHVVRASWQSESGGAVEKFADPRNIEKSPLPIILSGAWKDAKPLKEETIEGKFGKLSCEGTEGMLEFPMKRGGAMKCKLESRLNPETPFGVVSSHWIVATPGGTLEWNLKLAKHGQGAASKLPNVK
jgi:hypothetical protein